MDTNKAADRPPEPAAESAVQSSNASKAGTHPEKEKRVVILTAKALAERLDRLQRDRKAKLNKANNLKESIRVSMEKNETSMVQASFNDFVGLCNEAKTVHGSLMCLLPDDEKEKHETWFKAKTMHYDEFTYEMKEWLSGCEHLHLKGDHGVDDGVKPEDSVSNVVGKSSVTKSSSSGKVSTTSSAKIKAKAEKAALLARMAVLEEKHALEEQELKLRRKREQLELEALLSASSAKLAVLQAAEVQSISNICL